MISVSVGWKVLDKDSRKYKYIQAEKGGVQEMYILIVTQQLQILSQK